MYGILYVPQTPVLVDMSTQSFELHFDKKDLGGVWEI